MAVRGLAIHAVVRNRRSERALDALQRRGATPEYTLVDSGELAAAVTEADHPDSGLPQGALTGHGRVIARLLRRSSVVPVPFGLWARDAEGVRAFLEHQRVPLLEALDYFDDCFELRLHITAPLPPDAPERLAGMARHVYQELRRQAKAARILQEAGRGVILSAAFLLPRSEWIRFVEQVADWESRYRGVRFDVTGPWAAYDFVQLMP